MDLWNLTVRIILLSQTTTGILGNSSLMFYSLVLYCKEYTLKPTDLIVMNLVTANVLIILSSGVPQIMAIWGLKEFLKNFGCDLLLYIQRFGQSVSIWTTCLLSVFQTMIIRKSCWKDHKVKSAKYIGYSISILWVLHMWINFIFFMYTFIKRNSQNETRPQDFGYCSLTGSDEISAALYEALVVCPEVFLSMLTAWSSGSMIAILYRHKQRVQHIRSHHGPSRTSPESRATQKILVLVSTFLAFYTVSSILRGCVALLHSHNWWLMNISHFSSLCFPCFSPFFLISHNSFVSRFSLIWLRKRHLMFLL